MRRWLRVVGPVSALLVGHACGGHEADDPPPGPRRDPPPTSTTVVSPHETTVTAPVDRAPATLVRSRGTLRVDSVPPTDGAALERGQRVTLDEGAEAVIELASGDRVTLFGPSEAEIGEQGAAAVLLGRGSAHVRLPPGPAGPRAPLRVATPESSVELIGPGEVLLVADRSGATWTVALSGVARVANGNADARHHARTTELQGGQAVVTSDAVEEPTPGLTRLDDARAAAAAVFAPTTPLEPGRWVDRTRHAAIDLDASLGWLEAEARHGHDLTDQHRAAVAAGESDEAMRLQGALVGHAQELHALRDTARLRFERLSALVLAGAVAAGEPDPLAARRDRAAPLLGLE